MNEDEAYLSVAQRFLTSCEIHIQHQTNLQEVIGFESYHAFESIGGAYNAHYGHQVPRSHVGKLNAFVANSRHHGGVNARVIAALAMTLHSMRNRYLYPEQMGAEYRAPEEQISLTDVRRTVRRVRGIIREIEHLIN